MIVNNFNLYLIRHGQSEINMCPELLGQYSNTKLSLLGIKQGYLLNSFLKKENCNFDYIFSSSYLRALHTAKLATDSTSIIEVDDLREYSAGDWIGCKRSEVLNEETISQMNIHDLHFLPPNGESLSQVSRRASKWLEDNILYNQTYNNKNIALFSHCMTIKCILQYIMGFDKNFTWKLSIDNTSVTRLSFGSKGWMLHSLNDTSHLKQYIY